MTVRAFSTSADDMYATQSVPCLFPQWRYGQELAKFSLLTARGGEVNMGADGDEAILPVVSSWRRMVGATRGLASGGDMLTIHGSGFETNASGYNCVFSMGSARTVTSTFTALSDTLGTCATPQWKHMRGTANIDVYFNDLALAWAQDELLNVPFSVGNIDGRMCTGAGCPLPDGDLAGCLPAPCVSNVIVVSNSYDSRNFTFDDVFYAVTPSQAPAKGGTALVVDGWGWDASVEYSCAFSIDHAVGMVVPGTVVAGNKTHLACAAPAWGQKYAGISSANSAQRRPKLEVLAQHSGSGQVIADQGNKLTIDYQPSLSIRAGGVVLLNRASGSEHEYVVYTTWTAKPSGLYPSAVELTGLTRGAYGSKASVHPANRSAVFLTSLPYAPPGNESLAATASPLYTPVTSWSVTSLRNETGEDFTVTLTGSGFDTSTRYRFELRAQTSGSLYSWEAIPTNSTSLTLTSRPWPFRERAAQLVLTDSSGTVICESGVLETCTGAGGWFPFVSSWQSVSPDFAFARGGTQLEITGLGFGPGEPGYACRFVSDSHEEVTMATALSSTQLQCASPTWEFPAEMTMLFIYKGHILIPHAPGTDVAVPFDIRPNWESLMIPSGPTTSAGGFRITLSGHGFLEGSIEYTCSFAGADGFSATSRATVTSVNTLSCTVPVWGTSRPGGWVRIGATAHRSQAVIYAPPGASEATTCAWNNSACALFLPATYYLISPRIGSSMGGNQITISGYGFDRTRHNCSCVFGEGLERTQANVTSAVRATCMTPRWTHGGGKYFVSMQCRRNGQADTVAAPEDPSGIAAVTYEFESGWQSKDVSVGTAAGGTPIVIKGLGFFMPGSQEYM